MKSKFFLISLVLIFISLRSISQIHKLAYIYAGDFSRAQQYSLFLNPHAYQVDMFDTTEIISVNFNVYSLIIIGENSGFMSNWASSKKSDCINNTNKPILGLGEGGYAFFGKLGLGIGYAQGSHVNGDSIYVLQPTHQIFTGPNAITIPADSHLKIYTSNTPAVTYPVSSHEVFARYNNRGEQFIMIRESNRYFIWGFDGSPNNLTNDGKNLMLNIIDYIKAPISAINEDINPFDFNIYPNPVTQNTSLSYSLTTSAHVSITITNMMGQVLKTVLNLYQVPGRYNIPADFSCFPQGIYYVTLQTDKETFCEKVIISK